eukprot:2552896-Amphidinium_carterae.1
MVHFRAWCAHAPLAELCLGRLPFRLEPQAMTALALPASPLDSHWMQASGQPINVLELKASLATFRWRVRSSRSIGSRWLHASDHQVCLAVATEGRSSSRLLNHQLVKLNSVILAGSMYQRYVYVVPRRDGAIESSALWGHPHDCFGQAPAAGKTTGFGHFTADFAQ